MINGPILTTVSLLLCTLLVMPPLAISGGFGRGHTGAGHVGAVSHTGFGAHGRFGNHVGGAHGFGSVHSFHHGFGRHAFHHRFFSHRFFPFGAFGSPILVWGWPGAYGWPYYAGSAIYPDPSDFYTGPAYSPPVAYAPPPAPASTAPRAYSVNIYNPPPVAAPPAARPAVYEPPADPRPSAAPLGSPNVVEYEGGRYELRGDGMTTAYRWVWIPNPPPGPPGSAAMKAPASGELAPARRGTVYHWVDDEGTVHMSDRWLTVPQRYRQQAKQNLPY